LHLFREGLFIRFVHFVVAFFFYEDPITMVQITGSKDIFLLAYWQHMESIIETSCVE
jgi:hypothetical protein